MVDLKANPFFLDEENEKWVHETLASMSIEEKIGQMFCPIGSNIEEAFLKKFVEEFKPGAMLYRPMPAADVQRTHGVLQENSKIPMLFGANLESGGNGICAGGTYFARPMGVAATDNPVNSLSVEVYDRTYGAIWKEVVDAGTLSVMVGHIMQPAYSKYFNPELKDEEILPATLSKEILQGLLREKLGFNGMIVTDVTPMIGFNTPMKVFVIAATVLS